MFREKITPRSNWQDKVSSQGLIYHTPDGVPYWDESVCYQFTSGQIDELEEATNKLYEMCLTAVQYVIDEGLWDTFSIPTAIRPYLVDSWENESPSIYGRFDLAYNGIDPPKMLEFNSDTPTSLVEASVIQWHWLKDVKPHADQFNSIHEKLISQWREIRPYLRKNSPLYFTGVDSHEDMMTLAYLEDTAQQAGIETQTIKIGDLGWNPNSNDIRDLDERTIRNIFKLYPWEWKLGENIDAIVESYEKMLWIEPLWKLILSNKSILPILWHLNMGNEYLLEAYADSPSGMPEYVKKPKLSREGSNVAVISGVEVVHSTPGDYGDEGYVYQARADIPNLDGNFPVIGSWVVSDQGACGIGIRESNTLITDNLSRFVPHYFL